MSAPSELQQSLHRCQAQLPPCTSHACGSPTYMASFVSYSKLRCGIQEARTWTVGSREQAAKFLVRLGHAKLELLLKLLTTEHARPGKSKQDLAKLISMTDKSPHDLLLAPVFNEKSLRMAVKACQGSNSAYECLTFRHRGTMSSDLLQLRCLVLLLWEGGQV